MQVYYNGYYGYRTEELGEDDVSFKMINENASLVTMVAQRCCHGNSVLGITTAGLD